VLHAAVLQFGSAIGLTYLQPPCIDDPQPRGDQSQVSSIYRRRALTYMGDHKARVPLVVRYEPYTSRPSIDHHLIANIDWAPTMASIAGVPQPATAGRSFAPLLGKGRLRTPWRTQFLLEHLDGNPPSLAPSFCGIRSTRYMYALYQGGWQELYNLHKDPFELQNIASRPAEAPLIARMRALLHRECQPPPPGYTGAGPRTFRHSYPRVLTPCVQAVNRLRRYHQLFYQSGYAVCNK